MPFLLVLAHRQFGFERQPIQSDVNHGFCVDSSKKHVRFSLFRRITVVLTPLLALNAIRERQIRFAIGFTVSVRECN